jgi:hypothetical protein
MTKLALALTALVVLLAAAPTASAATFCVNRTPCPDGGTAKGSVSQAFADANANPDLDILYIGPGTYTDGPYAATQPLKAIGAGRDKTILTRAATGDNATILSLATAESSVSDLTVRLNAGVNVTGISLANPTTSAARVAVRDDETSGAHIGLAGGIATDLIVDMPVGGDGVGVVTSAVDRGTVASGTGIAGGTATHVHVIARTGAAGAFPFGGNTTLHDVLIDAQPPNPVGIDGAGGLGSTTVVGRHLTIRSTSGGVGLKAIGNGDFIFSSDATIDVRDTAILGFTTAFQRFGETVCTDFDPITPGCQGPGGTGSGNITASYSRYQGAVNDQGGPGTLSTPNTTTIGDPGFVNAGAGDLRPAYDSPLVNAGDPAPPGGEPATDLAGIARIVNGRSDIGAYEYGRRAPVAKAAVNPVTAGPGKLLAFSSAGSFDPDGDPLTFAWSFSGGGSATGASVSHGFSTPGTSTGTVTATDPVGLKGSATATATVGKAKAKSIKVSVKPKRDRTAPYKFKVSGRIVLPKGAAASLCGKTKVKVVLRHAKQKSVKRTKRVKTKKCRFSAKVGVPQTGKYKVLVSFPGNKSVRSKKAKPRTVRAG